MRRLGLFISLVWLLLLQACEPTELPEPFEADPIYFAEGELDGEPFVLNVGPDNVTVDSSADLVEGEIPLFSIEINGEDCTDCLGSLKFEITGGQEYNELLDFEDLSKLDSMSDHVAFFSSSHSYHIAVTYVTVSLYYNFSSNVSGHLLTFCDKSCGALFLYYY